MSLTAKGAATRARIVAAAADQVLERGVGGTSLDDVRGATSTSKSQLFHYFPDGKHELVRAIADFQGARVLDAQRPALDRLDSWESWQRWREAVLAHYTRVDGVRGCPIGSLTAEAAAFDPLLRDQLAAYWERWAELLADGVRRLRSAGLVDGAADPDAHATELLAAVQGGLLLAQVRGTLEPLETALDGALDHLRAHAVA
ncbi:TetR/AcrR family transcriptional regulator [Conexibacter sp. JD483]|uniref:TetR/AcrR family transcriptional regulator n=1 Tax=unclassified Conexibacter TaxID=2627773 RepID=UPI00271E6374|nr:MULTISPECIES: TetR/AcrR family transcriptional regulator [unclassified Conexibacter]MDO8187372.1 TetR/AcrR family transcriptional regulator [Conexibacter sp. CPCC 205706]MDO8200967.1 TetR/AcrR family transcriptional regulator [Conexibacter sp. CPCC 205762]MDR9371411.1 TetR/AcrR family transcriptional regulator [Conexibacter sp. JD483]